MLPNSLMHASPSVSVSHSLLRKLWGLAVTQVGRCPAQHLVRPAGRCGLLHACKVMLWAVARGCCAGVWQEPAVVGRVMPATFATLIRVSIVHLDGVSWRLAF